MSSGMDVVGMPVEQYWDQYWDQYWGAMGIFQTNWLSWGYQSV
jgi:hypothetical protein